MGSLIRRKNLASLVDAVAHRPSLDLTLAGEGPEEGALRRLADRLGAASRVRFVGHFPVGQHLDRMRELMRRAEVLCLPSHSESFGLVMTEALACGTPVVGFGPTLSEIEPLAGIDCGEAISTGTAEEIGLAIDRVLAHRWNRRRLRRAAVRAFHPRHTAHRYETLMRKLTSAKMAPA